MTPDSWERVKHLFGEAQDLSPMERPRFLEACGAELAEQHMVEDLLREHDRSGVFLEPPLTAGVAPASAPNESGRSARELSEGAIFRKRYLIRRELGRGGNGIVYAAEDLQMASRTVVVKLLHNTVLMGSSRRSMFRGEMEALARIDHPAVVTIFDVGDDPAEPFLVMQYVDGVTLRSELRPGPLPLGRAAAILRQIGEALDAAHAKRITHRDLKPENIMLQRSNDGTDVVRLIDFGIAKVETTRSAGQTTMLMLVGTTQYMAPEQLLGRASAASDVYALGVVAYEILTGSRPYEMDSPFDLLETQLRNRPPPMRTLRPDLPPGAGRLVLAALDFHPESRPRSAGAFATALSAALTARRRRWSGIATTALLLMVAGIFAARTSPLLLLAHRPSIPLERVIDKKNNLDPETEGFTRLHDASNDLTGTIAFNSDNSGYDGWRVTTRGQGFYVRPLGGAQVNAALARGWKMTAVTRSEEGGSVVIAAFREAHRRFDVFTYVDENGDQAVRTITQLLPHLEGPEYHLRGSGASFHSYQLVYDKESRQADLLVDGVKRLGGYSGHAEFADHSWFVFGTHLYRSKRGIATFRTLRFEINP